MFQALRHRLQVPEFVNMNAVCGCFRRVRLCEDQNHLAHCTAAALEIGRRHNAVRSLLAKFCKDCVGAAGQVTEEVNFVRRGELSACRMDVVNTNWT
jgi:hypothetical protein